MNGEHSTSDRSSQREHTQPVDRSPAQGGGLPRSVAHSGKLFGTGPDPNLVGQSARPSGPAASSLLNPLDEDAMSAMGGSPKHKPFMRRRLKFPRSWQFWGVTLVIAFSGLGILSATALLRLPSLPNCPGIFWPTASASLRMYCAQTAAEKRTVRDLLRAISLVNALPQDHPLRPEINRNIESWAKEILQLAEESFHAGDLDKAIETAKKIPANTAAYDLVENKIASWETIWKKAEDIYQQAEDALRSQDLRKAFRIATQLIGIGNQYWEDTKYRELNDLIVETRQDGSKLDKAKGLADKGGLTNLVAAIKLVEEIQPKSHLYTRAQEYIAQFGRDMLALAEAALDRQDYNQALKITGQIPDKAKLQEEIRDFNLIAEAQSQAWGGTIPDLEAAIVGAQRIKSDRPLYGKAQQLIGNWQLEIQDVTVLDRAKQMAQPGTAADLNTAIAEAQRIPFGNPRWEEAEKEIERWQSQIETSADQPYLDRAEQYANAGNWQAAINEASQIRPGRSLYDQASRRVEAWTAQIQRAQDQPQLDQARQLANAGDLEGAIAAARRIGSGRALANEAQSEIDQWSSRLERTQDQPYLDQARQLARQGNLGEAIAVAQQIGPDRALYDEAQAEIQQWRGQYQGQDQLQQAYRAASMQTPAMLVAAIEIAEQIPSNSATRSEADRMIDQWSYQILQLAEAQASFNLSEAIEIAERVPANTAAYGAAQRNIQTWRQLGGR